MRFRISICLFVLTWVTATLTWAKQDSLELRFQATEQETNDSIRFYKGYKYLKDVVIFDMDDENKKKAIPLAERLLHFAESRKKPLWIALSHECLGSLYVWTYQAEKVKFHIDKARQTLLAYKAYEALIYLYNSYASIRYQIGDAEGFKAWLKEAQGFARQSGSEDLEIKVLAVLAAGLKQRSRANESAAIYDELFKLSAKDTHDLAYTHSDASTTYLVLHDFRKAYYHNHLAYQLAKAKGYDEMFGSLIFNRACIAFEEGKYDESERLALESLPYIEKTGHLAFTESTYGLLMDINEAQKDWKEAFRYARIYNKLNDSLENFQNQAEYQKLDRKYKSELKDKTIRKQRTLLLVENERKKRWIAYGLAGSFVVALAGLVFYQNRKRRESQIKQAQTESEMKALRAQMNPHFMFNSLNAIQQMVLNNETTGAFQYLDTYSKLTRQILENSEKKWISIKDEIRFLELYLQMESLRFDHAFRWKIEVDESVSPHSDQIPAMLIQPLVENAIKHGLLPKDGDKNLRIRFKRYGDDGPLKVEVEDNGVGRQAASETVKQTSHKSMSLAITQNRLRLLSGPNAGKLEIEDLKDEKGQATGTRVWFYVSE